MKDEEVWGGHVAASLRDGGRGLKDSERCHSRGVRPGMGGQVFQAAYKWNG